jgi:hypothetical protein
MPATNPQNKQELSLHTTANPMVVVVRELPEPELGFWKTEICGLAMEMAVKLHGIKDHTTLKLALKDSLSLCSIAILLESEDPKKWTQIFRSEGVIGLTRKITIIAKEIAVREIPLSFENFQGKRCQVEDPQMNLTPREVLQKITTAAREGSIAAGLKMLQNFRKGAEKSRALTRLVNRLLETDAGRRCIRKLPEYTISDEFLLVAIPTLIGIPEKDIPDLKKLLYAKEENIQENLRIDIKPRTYLKAKSVFYAWVETLPKDEAAILLEKREGGTWFEQNVFSDSKKENG